MGRSGDRLLAALARGRCQDRGQAPHWTWGKTLSRLSSASSCRPLCLTLAPRGDNPPIPSFPVHDNPVFKGELVPDPRSVAKRINTGRAPACHPRRHLRRAGMAGSLPRALAIVLQQGGRRWLGSWRATKAVLCQSVTMMVTMVCTELCRFDPAGSCLGRPAGTHQTLGVFDPERQAAHGPCSGRCHHTWPTPLAMLSPVSCSWKLTAAVTPEHVTAQPAAAGGSRELGLGFGDARLGQACGSPLLGDT